MGGLVHARCYQVIDPGQAGDSLNHELCLSASTVGFNASAGSHTIEFLGLDSFGGDNTVFIDNVGITLV